MAPNYPPRAIRKLNRLVPELVLASLTNQAIRLRKIIGSTFEPSESLRALLGGMPQPHRELVLKVLSERSLRAFEAGGSDLAVDSLKGLASDEIDSKSKTIAIPRELQSKLVAEFESECKRYLDSFPKRNEVLIAVEAELQTAYQMGIAETASAPQPSVEPAPEMVVEELSIEMTAPVVEDQITPVSPEDSQQSVSASVATSAATPDMLARLEQYTKLLGDPMSEKVLRAVLGLPQLATASVVKAEGEEPIPAEEAPAAPEAESPEMAEEAEEAEEMAESSDSEESVESNIVGPFSVPELRAKTIDLAGSHRYTEEALQVLVVDCLVPEYQGLSDEDKAEALARALDQYEIVLDVFGSVELIDILDIADLMAEELTEKASLPGDFLFLENGEAFCLCFCFDKSFAEEMSKASKSLVTAAMSKSKTRAPKASGPSTKKPKLKGGAAVPEHEKREIMALKSGPELSGWLFKNLKKQAPMLADHISYLLKDVRNSVLPIGEFKRQMGYSLDEMVKIVYGEQGYEYYRS